MVLFQKHIFSLSILSTLIFISHHLFMQCQEGKNSYIPGGNEIGWFISLH